MIKLETIDILGVPYTVYLYKDNFRKLNDDAYERDKRYDLDNKSEKHNIDGYCDYSAKEIRVYTDKYYSKEYCEMVLRHEITHAFLFEIGYKYHDDEEFVDKISKWVPQIERITKKGLEVIKNARTKKESGSTKDNK